VTHIGRMFTMIACIVGNCNTGLLNLALMREFEHSNRSYAAYKRLLWNKSYARLKFHAGMSLVCTAKLIYLHKTFLSKYKEAALLKPLEVTFYAPVKRNCLIPLVKVHYQIATLLEDKIVLTSEEYLAKLDLYLRLKKHLKHVAFYTKRKHNSEVSEHQGEVVKALWEREMNDISSKMNYVASIKNILHLSGIVHSAVRTLNKAESLEKLSEYLSTRAKLGNAPNPSSLQRILNHPRPKKVNIYEIMLAETMNILKKEEKDGRSSLRRRTRADGIKEQKETRQEPRGKVSIFTLDHSAVKWGHMPLKIKHRLKALSRD